jgi:hypothetical protein
VSLFVAVSSSSSYCHRCNGNAAVSPSCRRPGARCHIAVVAFLSTCRRRTVALAREEGEDGDVPCRVESSRVVASNPSLVVVVWGAGIATVLLANDGEGEIQTPHEKISM